MGRSTYEEDPDGSQSCKWAQQEEHVRGRYRQVTGMQVGTARGPQPTTDTPTALKAVRSPETHFRCLFPAPPSTPHNRASTPLPVRPPPSCDHLPTASTAPHPPAVRPPHYPPPQPPRKSPPLPPLTLTSRYCPPRSPFRSPLFCCSLATAPPAAPLIPATTAAPTAAATAAASAAAKSPPVAPPATLPAAPSSPPPRTATPRLRERQREELNFREQVSARHDGHCRECVGAVGTRTTVGRRGAPSLKDRGSKRPGNAATELQSCATTERVVQACAPLAAFRRSLMSVAEMQTRCRLFVRSVW